MKKAKGRCAGIVVFCCLLCTYGLLAVCPYACLPTGRRGGNEPSQKSKIENRKSKIDSLVPEAVQIIETALADTDPSIKDNAIEVVATTRQIGLMPKVGRLLNDEFVSVRFTAALAVGDTQYRFVRESVGQLLKDRDENVRIAAAYAMYRLGYPDNFRLRGATVASAEALGLIRKAIVSKDQDIRANAALILGKFNSSLGPRDPSLERRTTSDERRATILKLLDWALSDKDSGDKVRFQVAEAMAMLGDERVYPKLWTMLISAYADDRVIGIRAMGALGTQQAKNALITMLGDKVLEVRLAAAEQLGCLGSTQGEPEVLDVFRKEFTAGMDAEGIERVHTFAALAIGQIRTAAVTEFLPKLLKNQSKRVRIAAAKAVLQCAK
jgi:HEAT repeat protein